MLLPSIKMMMPVPLAPSLLSFLFLQNKKQNFQAIHDVVGHRNALKSMLKIEGKNGGCEIQHFQLFPNFDQTSLFFSFPPFFLYIKLLLPRSRNEWWRITSSKWQPFFAKHFKSNELQPRKQQWKIKKCLEKFSNSANYFRAFFRVIEHFRYTWREGAIK